MWPSKIPSKSNCFEIQGHCVILSITGYPITKQRLTVLPRPLSRQNCFDQRVRFVPKLLRPHRLASKSKFPPELSDILVVRGILDVFLDVSPCRHMTVLSGLFVSWLWCWQAERNKANRCEQMCSINEFQFMAGRHVSEWKEFLLKKDKPNACSEVDSTPWRLG
jgi:hypothetical protein